MAPKVGHVTHRRYTQLVRECRDLVAQQTRCQFLIGDRALEIEPIRPHGGAHAAPDEELLTVSEAIDMFAQDIGIPASTARTYRWVSARWPADDRVAGVSHYIHRVFAGLDDRVTVINDPPLNERTGEPRWDTDSASRRAGWRPSTPLSPQERLNRITDLAKDDHVATAVTKNFLQRPQVAFAAMGDDTARHQVNAAQFDRSRQAMDVARQRTPAIAKIEHTIEFMDLVGACAQFVATAGRILPTLHGRRFSAEERGTVHKNIARVRSTADWIETAVETGDVSVDEGLARMLRGD
jgi:hypothetical protein